MTKSSLKRTITIALHKPYKYLTQFSKNVALNDKKSSAEGEGLKLSQWTLADIQSLKSLPTLPKHRNIYPIGRLDADSEGLLLLSNDKSIVNRLLDPSYSTAKDYM